MGLKHLLTLREPAYPSLVKVFYSNMIISLTSRNKIFTNVGGVQKAFDVEELNRILRIQNEGFQVFSSRHKIERMWFHVVDTMHNIYRRFDLLQFFCNASFKAQVLPLQVKVGTLSSSTLLALDWGFLMRLPVDVGISLFSTCLAPLKIKVDLFPTVVSSSNSLSNFMFL